MTGLNKNRGRERITREEGDASEFLVVESAGLLNLPVADSMCGDFRMESFECVMRRSNVRSGNEYCYFKGILPCLLKGKW